MASRKVTLCRLPVESVQPTCTRAPGWYRCISDVSAGAECTVLPPSDVMTSPATSPADEAGEPDSTWCMTAPDGEELEVTSTPRSAVGPMCTLAEA